MTLSIGVVVPTYAREALLVDSLRALVPLLTPADALLVVDQTREHDPATSAALTALAAEGRLRWVKKGHPSQCEAMNLGARLLETDVILFLDDDIVPSSGLLEAYRRAFADDPGLVIANGQVLQPWDAAARPGVSRGRGLDFDFASSEPCDMLSAIGCNVAVRRQAFLDAGGMDESFTGANYRNDAELAYRLHARTGRLVRFVPQASVRHLHAAGGNRAFGHEASWRHIGGSVGDYYFALKCLSGRARVAHVLRRLLREPLNRLTIRRPWLVPMLAVRELVALGRAWGRLRARPERYARPLAAYHDLEQPADPAGRSQREAGTSAE